MKAKDSIILLAAIFTALVISTLPAQTDAQSGKKITRKKNVKSNMEPCKSFSTKTFAFGSSEISPANKLQESNKNSDGKNSLGVLNGVAINLVIPKYPAAGKAVRASGAVNVQVLIDQKGNVISANATSGHPLLRQSAENAARTSTFNPTTLGGCPVKVLGIIVYNFVAQ